MRNWGILCAALLLCGILATCAGGQEGKGEAAKKQFWIFLVTGKSTAGVAKEEIAAKQKAHIDNFKRQAEAKSLFLAGPMADPAKVKRGIVLVAVEDEKQIPDLFNLDPYVKEEFMKLDASEITKMDGKTVVDFAATEMEELRIAVFDRAVGGAGKAGAELEAALSSHEAYWTKWRAAKKVALRCRFSDKSPHFGIVMFPNVGDDEIKKLLDGDPMVATKMINYSLMPQYLMKGAVSVE
jgi:uncharacterized protein YciI